LLQTPGHPGPRLLSMLIPTCAHTAAF
jgi:hypothetical protein